ncbi:27982_t:CDS:2, partial [Racocetra persica]
NDNKASFLIQKAEILAELELFSLFPQQRRWRHWFPDYIYYKAHVDEVRSKIREINGLNWHGVEKPILQPELLKLI